MIACDCFPCYKHDNINLVNFVINDLVKSKSAVLSAKTEVKISYPILVIAQTDVTDKRETVSSLSSLSDFYQLKNIHVHAFYFKTY